MAWRRGGGTDRRGAERLRALQVSRLHILSSRCERRRQPLSTSRYLSPTAARKPEILRVPSLRNVATTAPYFHDGSASTLPAAVKAMGVAQLDRALSDQQIAAVVAFLNTLTGTYRGQAVRPPAATPRTGSPIQ